MIYPKVYNYERKKLMKQPNIFTYATSELSQDAFLCWFIEWAKPQHHESNRLLHQLAQKFLQKIFLKHQIDFPRLESIKIERQVENIDVLIVINEIYAIIIEDKTFTSEHSNQLTRYLQTINETKAYLHKLPIYYKTGNQGDYSKVYQAGYKVFKREEMINLFERNHISQIKSDILQNYYQHLLAIDATYNDFLTLPKSKWSRRSWQGFYTRLQQSLQGKWGNVSNQRGGFVCFSWNFRSLKNCLLYIQLEVDHSNQHATLCLKIRVTSDENKSNLRNFWYRNTMKEVTSDSLVFTKPSSFGHGETMTFAVLKDDYRVMMNNRIHMQETIQILKKAELFLNRLIETYDKE